MVRSWCVLYILTSKCASRRNACNCSSLIWPDGSAPAALVSLLFDPPFRSHTSVEKGSVSRLSHLCAHLHLLSSDSSSSLICSLLLFSSLCLCPSLLFICPNFLRLLVYRILYDVVWHMVWYGMTRNRNTKKVEVNILQLTKNKKRLHTCIFPHAGPSVFTDPLEFVSLMEHMEDMEDLENLIRMASLKWNEHGNGRHGRVGRSHGEGGSWDGEKFYVVFMKNGWRTYPFCTFVVCVHPEGTPATRHNFAHMSVSLCGCMCAWVI